MSKAMSATMTTGFQMGCKKCAREVCVGPTAYYRDADTRTRRTAYFAPDAEAPSVAGIIGTSAGSGDSFECALCTSPNIGNKEVGDE